MGCLLKKVSSSGRRGCERKVRTLLIVGWRKARAIVCAPMSYDDLTNTLKNDFFFPSHKTQASILLGSGRSSGVIRVLGNRAARSQSSTAQSSACKEQTARITDVTPRQPMPDPRVDPNVFVRIRLLPRPLRCQIQHQFYCLPAEHLRCANLMECCQQQSSIVHRLCRGDDVASTTAGSRNRAAWGNLIPRSQASCTGHMMAPAGSGSGGWQKSINACGLYSCVQWRQVKRVDLPNSQTRPTSPAGRRRLCSQGLCTRTQRSPRLGEEDDETIHRRHAVSNRQVLIWHNNNNGQGSKRGT